MGSKNLKDKFPFIYGLIAAMIIVVLDYKFNFNYKLRGFENVLESIIGFLSIIIGFYSAFYGMIISMLKSKLMKELAKPKNRDILPKILKKSLRLSFLTLVMTIIFQLLKDFKPLDFRAFQCLRITWVDIYYWIWSFLVVSCIVYSYNIAMTSISMIFFSDPNKKQTIEI